MSVCSLNTAVRRDRPALEEDRRLTRPGAPLRACSSGMVTRDSTCVEVSPGASVCTAIRGGANSGNTSIGAESAARDPNTRRAPARTRTTRRLAMEKETSRESTSAISRGVVLVVFLRGDAGPEHFPQQGLSAARHDLGAVGEPLQDLRAPRLVGADANPDLLVRVAMLDEQHAGRPFEEEGGGRHAQGRPLVDPDLRRADLLGTQAVLGVLYGDTRGQRARLWLQEVRQGNDAGAKQLVRGSLDVQPRRRPRLHLGDLRLVDLRQRPHVGPGKRLLARRIETHVVERRMWELALYAGIHEFTFTDLHRL